MQRELESKELIGLFLRLVHKVNAMEKAPVEHGKEFRLYHSERHMLDKVGDDPGMNVTEFARAVGVTKGAISQVIRKLETKGLVRRYKKSRNEKEVFIELTSQGRDFYEERKRINKETIREISEELRLHSDDKVAFLLRMFHWFDMFLDRSMEAMAQNERS
jgi:DNA-binding MarR family transcriptional regulator